MALDGTVKVLESDVAAHCGATLSPTQEYYTMFGLNVPIPDFESTINSAAFQERNELGDVTYNSTETKTANAVKAYQLWDSVVRILVALPPRVPMYFTASLGDLSIEPAAIISQIDAAIARATKERDRAFNELQQATYFVQTAQPGYGETASPIY